MGSNKFSSNNPLYKIKEVEKNMTVNSRANDLRAFDLVRQAAHEYTGSEYKFYENGFFKYVRSSEHSVLIEDIYVVPEFRNTPVSKMIMESFTSFLKQNKIFAYHGHVWKADVKGHKKRLATFQKWGMKILDDNEYYTTVYGNIEV